MPSVPFEITKESYFLKSTFFYEKLVSLGFFSMFEDVKNFASIHSNSIAWDDKRELGVSNDSWEIINKLNIEPLLVFAHPNILRIRPELLKYYRCVAMLPQKGFQAISKVSSISQIESKNRSIHESKLLNVVATINELMSVIIKLSIDLNENQLQGMMFATAGTNIDGSWRNSIGFEGERVIRTLIVKGLIDNSEISGFIHKNNSTSKLSDWKGKDPVAEISDIKAIEISNGTTILFASEPDVTLMNPQGKILGGIEIKAGLDPAGALERLGAMFKSFEEIKQSYPGAETILVASCVTPEVESRIRESRSVTLTYILTNIVSNKRNESDKFLNNIRSILGLIERRI